MNIRTMVATGALGAGCVAVVAAGTGYAVAASQGHVIHGCVAKSNGALRVVGGSKDCGAHETPLSFNQTGPRGPRGAAGLQGAPGSQGPAGPAVAPHMYRGYVESVRLPVAGYGTVLTVQLPAGTYDFRWVADVTGPAPNGSSVVCEVTTTSEGLAMPEIDGRIPEGNTFVVLTDDNEVQLANLQNLTLQCRNENLQNTAPAQEVYLAHIVAIQVGAVN
jgi:hypothetical protein